MIVGHRYVLAVPDADVTARFFVEVLGFESSLVIEAQWHFVRRDEVVVMLGTCPNDLPPDRLGCHSYFAYLLVEDVDALHREIVSRGFEGDPPESKPWGAREMLVTTPDGHRMMFATVDPG